MTNDNAPPPLFICDCPDCIDAPESIHQFCHLLTCDDLAVETVTVGCVHEHVSEQALCRYCARLARRGALRCTRCHLAGHECAVYPAGQTVTS